MFLFDHQTSSHQSARVGHYHLDNDFVALLRHYAPGRSSPECGKYKIFLSGQSLVVADVQKVINFLPR